VVPRTLSALCLHRPNSRYAIGAGEDLLACFLATCSMRLAGRGHTHIACEVNVDPPNPTSDAFHAALGFVEIGCASIHDGSKSVRYLERTLDVTTAR
jgi:predicted GNAT superfamily acetyltransferase